MANAIIGGGSVTPKPKPVNVTPGRGSAGSGTPRGGGLYRPPNQGVSIAPPRVANEVAPGLAAQAKAKGPSAKQLQSMLRSRGYNLKVDGVWGPISRSAYKAFKAGVGARRWNGNHPGSIAAAGRGSGGAGGSGGGSGGGTGGSGGGGGGRGRGGRGGGGMRGAGIQIPNAKAYAKSEIAAQYNPILNELRYQRDQQQSQGAQDLADIKSYYGQLANTLSQVQSAGDAFQQAALQQSQADQQGILRSIGGGANPAAGAVGSFADLMHGALQGTLAAQQNYMTNQQALAAQGQAQALTNQQRITQQAVQGINQQINSELGSRSSDYLKALADAQQQRLQDMAALQNMQIAAGQFGLSMKQGAAQLANQNLQNKALKQQLSGKAGNFKSLTAADRSKLVEQVNTVMYDPHTGEAAMSPMQAWVKAANTLRALGFDVQASPRARNWLSQSWMNYVTDYNQSHPNKQYKPAKNGTPYVNWG